MRVWRRLRCGLSAIVAGSALIAGTCMVSRSPAIASEGDILVFCPVAPLAQGEVFEARIVIDVGGRVLGSYSADLLYDPAKVVILDVLGGATSEFALAPSTNPASFSSGTTPIAGLNLSSMVSPGGEVEIARLLLENRAGPGDAYNFIVSPTAASDPGGSPIDAVNGACAVFVDAPSATPTPSPTPTPPPASVCVGDCDNDSNVTVDEIITGVAIALGIRDVSSCLPFDGDGDGEVVVTEIVSAVNSSLVGCPVPSPTPTPTATGTSTPTPTATATRTPPANLPPIIPDPGLYRAYPGEAIAFVIGARDPEGGSLTYSATDIPSGASFDPVGGVLRWTPAAEQAGPHYVSVVVTDNGEFPASAETLLRFQVDLPTECVEARCDAATGCSLAPLPLAQSCCTEGVEPERIAFADAECPQGGVVFAGRNTESDIGRLENCDWVRVQNFAQTGAVVRLNFETRCLRPEAGIRVRVRLQAPSRVVVDDDVTLTFFSGDNGYLERVSVPFPVLGGGPFFDLEFVEAQLSVIASDPFGNSVRTDKRVRLTFDRLADLEDPVSVAP